MIKNGDEPMVSSSSNLTLGPVLFNWPVDDWRDFYYRIADEADVNTVCVGEVVCAKRTPFRTPMMADVVERLIAGGKEVVISTLALIMNKREMEEVRVLVADADLMIEANDIATASLLAGQPHALGPLVNVYNEGTLSYLAANGATRVCLPIEMKAPAIEALANEKVAEIEVMVFGRLPLAISARCYHARARALSKDGCQYVCEDDLDGMAVDTLDGDPFVAVNGLQTLSHSYTNLAGEITNLQSMGVNRFRLSPHSIDMVAVAHIFRDVTEERMQAPEAAFLLGSLIGNSPLSNGYYHGAAGAALITAQA